MVEITRVDVCASAALQDSGAGVRFDVPTPIGTRPAFAIRHRGRVYAYLNRCAHLAVELDWNPGEFFDSTGEFLICATHGARYHPASGACSSGRCNGKGLVALKTEECDGSVSVIYSLSMEAL